MNLSNFHLRTLSPGGAQLATEHGRDCIRVDHWFVGGPANQAKRVEFIQDYQHHAPFQAPLVYHIDTFMERDYPLDEDGEAILWFPQDADPEDFQNRSAPLAFQLIAGELQITTRWDAHAATPDREATHPETLYRCPASTLFGHWTQWKVEVTWDWRADGIGSLAIHRDGYEIVHHDGPIGYHDQLGPRLAFGCYHWRYNNPFNHKTIWFSNVEIT